VTAVAGRVLALVDGEHYPPVVRDAVARAGGVVAALLVGGGEKLDGEPDYGVPLVRAGRDTAVSMVETARLHGAGRVLDLSDEPVVGEAVRLHLVAHALAAGLGYGGPGFWFEPPPREPAPVPTIEVVGTGKRVGKTAVSGHLVRMARAAGLDLVVVAMGRGGPAVPELVGAGVPLGPAELLARARAGNHAASDFLEDAALTGAATVGARRCGGGPAGEPFTSNVAEALELAVGQHPDLVVLEGSGAALPPVAADRRVLVCTAARPASELTSGLGPYRVLGADLVVITGCLPPVSAAGAAERTREAVRAIRPDLESIAVDLVPQPVVPVAGRRVAYFTTAPAALAARLAGELEQAHGARVTATVPLLSDRAALRAALEADGVHAADTFVVEIKAAAIDVVAEAADRRGVELVFCDNRPRSLPGEPDLDARLTAMATGVARA